MSANGSNLVPLPGDDGFGVDLLARLDGGYITVAEAHEPYDLHELIVRATPLAAPAAPSNGDPYLPEGFDPVEAARRFDEMYPPSEEPVAG